MRKWMILTLAFLGLPDVASAACGSSGLFGRARARLANRPHLVRPAAVPAPPRLIGLPGGCVPVQAPAGPLPVKK